MKTALMIAAQPDRGLSKRECTSFIQRLVKSILLRRLTLGENIE